MIARCWTAGAGCGVVIALASLLARPAPLAARQERCLHDLAIGSQCGVPAPPDEMPRWLGHTVTLGVNAALGGLTAGIAQYARGESFWNGFLHGSAGGSVTYLGKRISGARFTGAGLLGRELAAVGSSMVRNAAHGREPFARLVLPIGPLRLHVDRAAPEPLRVKLDLTSAVVAGYVLARYDARLDASSSLSAGTLVFAVPDRHRARVAGGMHVAGVIWYPAGLAAAWTGDSEVRRLLTHEQIHVVQYDFGSLAWGAPLDRWLIERLPGGTAAGRYIDLGVSALVLDFPKLLIDYPDRPWEREAYFLDAREGDPW